MIPFHRFLVLTSIIGSFRYLEYDFLFFILSRFISLVAFLPSSKYLFEEYTSYSNCLGKYIYHGIRNLVVVVIFVEYVIMQGGTWKSDLNDRSICTGTISNESWDIAAGQLNYFVKLWPQKSVNYRALGLIK